MTPSITDNPPGRNDPEEDECVSVPVTIQIMSSSGSDSDDDWNQGYELLPQEADGDVPAEQESPPPTWSEVSQPEHGIIAVPETSEFQEQPQGAMASEPFLMDEDHIEKIKAAMAGFTLPSSSIPSWASIVPEDQWKDRLLTLMNSRVDQRPRRLIQTETDDMGSSK